MEADIWIRMIMVGMMAALAFIAWKRKDRRDAIYLMLPAVGMMALFIPAEFPVLRYGIAGAALGLVLVRSVKRDLIDGSDPIARFMTIGILVFVASFIPVMLLPSPPPAWAKYVAIGGAVAMLVGLLRPLWWMTRLLFSAHRLHRDLTHSRPPREADEKVLEIDLSFMRKPRDQ